MRSMSKCIGECTECGDEVYVFRTRSHKRFAQCVNEECNESFPLPSKGSIEETGLDCPITGTQIIAVVPNIRLSRGNFKQQTKKTYFWAKKPCFTCPDQYSCEALKDAKNDYDLEE